MFETDWSKLSWATVRVSGLKNDKFPFLEKKLKVKIIFERFRPALKTEWKSFKRLLIECFCLFDIDTYKNKIDPSGYI